jgi:hypothetical protein
MARKARKRTLIAAGFAAFGLSFFAGALFVVDRFVLYGSYNVKYPPAPTSPPVKPLDRYKLYELVNAYRASIGRNELVFDPSMCPFSKRRLE